MSCPVNPGDILAGKYRVEEVLGEGGMGVVVAARHLELDQRVAMKFLLPSLAENKEATARFRREARAAVKIQSDHVARVIDVGNLDDGIPYIVIEYLHGRDVAAELKERGRFDVAEAAELVLDACEAIAAAHVVGIIHRDLKPSNLFLTQRPDYSRCLKVLDFGISKSLAGDSSDSQFGLTRTRAVVGSPLYMAPEQLESSRNADERADIWSLGVILHELVTGSVPFRGESLPQLVRAVLVGDRVRPSSLTPGLSADFEAVIDRCLAHHRDERYTSVTELAQALAPFTHSGAASAQRVSRILRHSIAPSKASTPFIPFIPGDSHLDSKTPEPRSLPNHEATMEAPTVSSWGNTGGTQKSGKRLWLTLSAVAGLLAVGFGIWLTRSPQDEQLPSENAVQSVTEVVTALAVTFAPVDPAPTAADVALSAATAASAIPAEAAGVTSTEIAVTTSAALQPPMPPQVPTPMAVPYPKVFPGRVSPPIQPLPPVSSEPKAPGFTNFGGRR